MSSDASPELIRQQALAALTSELAKQGHPAQYAQHMAAAVIFQADLDLCAAQLARLLSWLKQNHPEAYPEAVQLVDATRDEFERRVQNG
ncbi:MAG: hypothetical protein Q6M04_02405 [Thermostichus sp. BF3_bins_97]